MVVGGIKGRARPFLVVSGINKKKAPLLPWWWYVVLVVWWCGVVWCVVRTFFFSSGLTFYSLIKIQEG